MSKEKDENLGKTRRLNSEEIEKKAKNKRVKASSETQVVGKVNTNKNSKKQKKKKKKFKERHPRIATIFRIILILILLCIIALAGIIAGAIWGGYNFFDLLGDDYKIDVTDLVVDA
jgi:hypothetical protein